MGVARSLIEAKLLQRFVTTVAFRKGTRITNSIRSSYRLARMRGREVPTFLDVPVETFPAHELINVGARWLGFGELGCHKIWEWTETAFDRKVAARWAGQAPCLYGCEHASVETFKAQKMSGGYNILWQPIAHHRTLLRLLREESESFPETVTSYLKQLLSDAERINDRKDSQHAAADLIVTNSEFARQTFISAGLAKEKVKVVPTGCPPAHTIRDVSRRRNAKMIFLHAGTQSTRKGTHYLLEAWRRLSNSSLGELWLVGKRQLPEGFFKGLSNVVLRSTMSRFQLNAIFERVSVLVLPTLCEGLAHVILEAMARGVAIITTPNSGCGDLVEDGLNGWYVPIRDVAALVDRIRWCLESPAEVLEMQRQSLRKAAAWQEEDFARSHAQVVRNFLHEKSIANNFQYPPSSEKGLLNNSLLVPTWRA
jgi:glycosyltransferase involved in cell wall biosynthesis